MAKKTLLQMVQTILSAIDGDEVNSIFDTTESTQVAEEVRNTYEDMVATLSIPERYGLVQLESVGNTAQPNLLKIPDGVRSIEWVKYNSTDIKYQDPKEFLDLILHGVPSTTTTTVTAPNGFKYTIQSNKDPIYFTSFDDKYLTFNSINLALDSTLQQSKSIAYCQLNNSFQMEDNFICDLDDNLFPTLIASAKEACFINMKQVANNNESNRAKRGMARWQNETHRTKTPNPIDRLPDYSRRR